MPFDPNSPFDPTDPAQWWRLRNLPHILVQPNAPPNPASGNAEDDGLPDDWFVPEADGFPNDWINPDNHNASAPAAAAASSPPTPSLPPGFRIGINDPSNGVFLPADRSTQVINGEAIHASLHTNAYFEAVEQELKQATSRDDALRILRSIGQRLQSRTFP
jgi:hypothetical protein